jgi:RNA polymerase sigma-70 factor (ECF subfamily)
MDDCTRAAFLQTIPHLRAFAVSLTNDREAADDLVQETLMRGLTHIGRFQAGTNLEAWLFTILRNQFYTAYRKRRRETEDPDGVFASKLAVIPEQGAKLDYDDMLAALARLTPAQREAILLIGAEGHSYEEAARICNTSVGTIKSRVNRARTRLAEVLGFERKDGLPTDALIQGMSYAGLAA